MDSDKFPFYRAELYHQFHNDFQVRGPGHRSAVGQGQGLGGGSWRVGSVSFLVGLGEAHTLRVPGFRPTPIGGFLPIYLNMRMHNIVCVPRAGPGVWHGLQSASARACQGGPPRHHRLPGGGVLSRGACEQRAAGAA